MGVSVREEPHMSATPANKAHSTNLNGPSCLPGAVENMVLRPDRPAWDIRGTTGAGDRTPVTVPRGRRWSMGTEAFVLTNSAESCSCRDSECLARICHQYAYVSAFVPAL